MPPELVTPPELVVPAESISPPELNPPPAVGLEPPAPFPAALFDEPHPMFNAATKSVRRSGVRSRRLAERHSCEVGERICNAMIRRSWLDLEGRAD